MRKQSYSILILTAVFGIYPFGAEAFLLPPTPTTVDMDFISSVEAYVDYGQKCVDEVENYYTQYMGDINNTVSGAQSWVNTQLNSISAIDPLENVLGKEAGVPNIPVAREVQESTVADIKNESEIIEAFDKMFLRLPVDTMKKDKYKNDQQAVINAYKAKGQNFYNDSMIEMYLTVRALEDTMSILNEQFEQLTACFVSGEKTADEGDETSLCAYAAETTADLGIWNNYYRINLIYDKMLRITEELTAIRAQYEVAQAFASGIQPLTEVEQQVVDGEYVDEADKETQESTSADKTSDASDIFRWTMTVSSSFAQQTTDTSSEGTSESNNNKYARVEAKTLATHGPLSGSPEKYEDMARLANIDENLSLAREVHNLKNKMPEFRKVFVSANQMKQLHEKAIAELQESEDCAMNYLSQYYNSPEKAWLGTGCVQSGREINCSRGFTLTRDNMDKIEAGDYFCSSDSNEICQKFSVNKYENRQGLSGWLISAYKTAKATIAIDLTEDGEDELSPAMIDDNSDTGDLLSSLDSKQTEASQDADTADTTWTRPSKEAEVNEATRANNLISWQIGAEGAKLLSKEMENKTLATYGQVSADYPLWNDDKYFYEQYLYEKYNNMKLYVHNMDMRSITLDAMSALISKIKTNQTVGSLQAIDLLGVLGTVRATLDSLIEAEEAETDQKNEEIQTSLDNLEDKLDLLEADYQAKLQKLNDRKTEIYAVLDEQGETLKEQKTAYNETVSSKQQMQGLSEAQDTNLEQLDERQKKYKETHDGKEYVSGFEKTAKEDKNSYAEAGNDLENQRVQQADAIEATREKMDNYNDELDLIENQIEQLQIEYVRQLAELELQRNDLEDQLSLSQTAPTLKQSKVLTQAFSATNVTGVQRSAFNLLLDLAEEYTSSAREQIEEEIDQTYAEIVRLEGSAYDPNNHQTLLDLHADMMSAISEDLRLSEIKTTLPLDFVSEAVRQVIVRDFYQKVCAGDSCLDADDTYFVGLPPKKQDFQAPRLIIGDYTPPLREVVHFDSVDYENVLKDGYRTTQKTFLNGEQEIPLIWERILKPNGFEEKSVRVQAILAHNEGAQDYLLRGGTYPCSIGRWTIDFLNGDLYVYPGYSDETCREIQKLETSSAGSASLLFNNGKRIKASIGSTPEEHEPSELAQLLQFENGVYFSDQIQDIEEFFERMEDEENPDDESSILDKLYGHALLARNQFGDFLDFVELEMKYQTALDELEVKLDETRQTLIEACQKFGYELSEDFDLSDEKTYADLAQAFDDRKNDLIENYVKPQKSELKTADSSDVTDLVKEKVERVANQIAVLEEDSEELLSLSSSDTPDASFNSRLASAQADREALDKYQNEADEAFEELLNDFKQPYCANY